MTYRGRFAPSPTGPLHFGSLVAAVGSWLSARHAGGQWLLRMEDIDPTREVAGATAGILAALPAFGLVADAPPLFIALTADDPFFANNGFGLVDSWRAAKRPVEFHLFEQGGHGFGMYQKETTSTGWFDEFTRWLDMHGYLKPKA